MHRRTGRRGAKVIGAASIIDRSNGAADVGVPRISLATLDVPSYQPDDCPMSRRGRQRNETRQPAREGMKDKG